MKMTSVIAILLIAATTAAAQPQPKFTVADRYRLENIERSIQIRQESRISQNQDEVDALRAEKRKIYAKYGLTDPNSRRSASAAADEDQGQRQRPIPMTDGGWLYPNDPSGRNFTSNDGVVYTRSGANILINTQTGETVILH